jgi:ABC-type multidrug transport system permease subunit
LETWVFPGDLSTPVFVFIILFFGTSTFTVPGQPVNRHVPLWIWIHSLLLNKLLK